MTSSDDSSDEGDYEINFTPKYFLRCHSKQRKDAADVQTNVWECAFEPSSKSDEPSNIVATCGGNSICFIDITTGKVMKKYYSSKSGENFFTLAWTRIKDHNILAAGGSVQTINFITYDEGVCFHEEKFDRSIIGIKVGITSIRFHPIATNILYCSCSSGKVLVMNIGSPTAPDFSVNIQILQQYEVHCEVFLLVYYLSKELILGTSDDGIYCWNGNPELMGSSGKNKILLQFPGRSLALTNAPSLVDTVEVLENGLIASKCALRGAIYIWNIDDILKDAGNEDLTLRITPLYHLEWSNTDNYFMYLCYDKGCKYLACGDDKGAIWTYDIKALIKSPNGVEGTVSTTMIKPTTIFEWPNLEDAYASRKRKLNLNVYDIVINKTILSYNSEYLVAVTNKNMVCIWKKKHKKTHK